MDNIRWSYGDQIIYRGLWKGSIYWALPVTVVQDSKDVIALYWPAGTPVKRPTTRATIEELSTTPYPEISDSYWTDTDILLLCNAGKPYSINCMRSAESGELLCWYVNIQAPLHRMGIGFETEDFLLDVVFQPDLRTWKLKDEDELDVALALGLFGDQAVSEIRAGAEDAIKSITSGNSPVNTYWSSWTPPASWDIPEMPDYWDSNSSSP